MKKFKQLLLTKITDESIIDEYLNYINTHKLSKDPNKKDGSFEVHHILPRSLFLEYEHDKDNLVCLKFYDHFVAHYIIAKSRNLKMLFAFNMMNRLKSKFDEVELHQAALLYQELKSDYIKAAKLAAKNRPPMSEIIKTKISESLKGKIPALDITTGIRTRVSLEDFYANDNLIHHQSGRKHSKETKEKMSANGIKGLTAFTNIETEEVIYRDSTFSDPMFIKGNPKMNKLTSELTKDRYFWTNTKTGQCIRSKTCPGEDWIKARTNFDNPFKGKAIVIDLLVGKRLTLDKSMLTKFQVGHTKKVIETPTKIYANIEKCIEDLNITLNLHEFRRAIDNLEVSNKTLEILKTVDISGFKAVQARHIVYPNNKEIVV